MENGFQPEQWHDFYVMLGTCAGALVGLLFVVTSLHLSAMKSNLDFNLRARNNTYHLLTVLVETALVLMPQPVLALGVELIVINLFGLRLPIGISYRYLHVTKGKLFDGVFPIYIIITIIVGYLLGIAGGLGLIENTGWGMQAVAVSCIIILVRSVLTAWKLMFGMIQFDAKTKED